MGMEHGSLAIFGTLPEFTVDLDACTYGWGASCEGLYMWGTSGLLRRDPSNINALELLAGLMDCLALSRSIKGADIGVKILHKGICEQQPMCFLAGLRQGQISQFWLYFE